MVLLGGALGISLAPQIKALSGGLYKALTPIANAYANLSGHRQMGLRYDDLIMEERDDVQKAINRMSSRESYDRAYRMRRAMQQDILHKPLPKNEQLTADQDVRYLKPRIDEVIKEDQEREMYDNMVVSKRK